MVSLTCKGHLRQRHTSGSLKSISSGQGLLECSYILNGHTQYRCAEYDDDVAAAVDDDDVAAVDDDVAAVAAAAAGDADAEAAPWLQDTRKAIDNIYVFHTSNGFLDYR